MPTNSLNDYATTPSANQNIAGTNIQIGMAPQNVGVFIRTIMSQIAYAVQGSGGAIPATWHVGALTATTVNATNLTVSGGYSTNISFLAGLTVPFGQSVTLGDTINAIVFTGLNATFGATSDGAAFDMSGSAHAIYSYSDLTNIYAWQHGASLPMSLNAANGNLTITGTLAQASDRRLKSDIVSISPDVGLKWLKASRPVEYTMSGQATAGFIAQEQIAAGFPVGITTHVNREMKGDRDSPDGEQFVMDASSRIAFLTAALQNALARIEALERRV